MYSNGLYKVENLRALEIKSSQEFLTLHMD